LADTDLPSIPGEMPERTDGGKIASFDQDDESLVFDEDPVIHKAVKFIRKQVRTSILATALKIGYYVLKEYYHDSAGEARSRKPEKHASFRKLCDNKYLPLSKSSLNEMVRLAVQDRVFQRNNMEESVAGLTYSHLNEVAKLPSLNSKKKLVAEIKKDGLSANKTAERVREIRKKQQEKEPDVHILDNSQLTRLQDLLTTFMSFGLNLDLTNLPEPLSDRRRQLGDNVTQILQELWTVRVMFKELDKFLTVQVAGQLNPDGEGEEEPSNSD